MKIIIEGAGKVGSHIAKMLRNEGNSVTVIDFDEKKLHTLNSSVDIIPICGNPTSMKVLRSAGVGEADLLISVVPDVPQEVNLIGASMAKSLGCAKCVARVKGSEYLEGQGRKYISDIGVDNIFYPEKIASEEIVSALQHNASTELMDIARGKMQFAIFKLDEASPVLDMKLIDAINSIEPEFRSQFRIISVVRENRTIIPKAETKFRFGDTIYVLSLKEATEKVYHYFGRNDSRAERVMIAGGSNMTEVLAHELSAQDIATTIIENDRERCLQLSEALPDNIKVIHGDSKDFDTMLNEGLGKCDAFLALSDDDADNVLNCVAVKKFGINRTMAKVENMEYMRIADELGIDNVINNTILSAGRVLRLSLSDKALFVRCLTETDAEVLEYNVTGNSRITGKPLNTIKFPENAIIGGVTRGNEGFIAVGDTVLQADDRVVIFATSDAVKNIETFFK